MTAINCRLYTEIENESASQATIYGIKAIHSGENYERNLKWCYCAIGNKHAPTEPGKQVCPLTQMA